MKPTKLKLIAGPITAAALLAGGGALAAEDGKSVYLLGVNASMAGMTPPPGIYFSSIGYYYSGDGTGAAALSRDLGLVDRLHPPATLETEAHLKATANVALDVLSVMWVPSAQFLGGNFGFGVLAPVGNQGVDININALRTVTFPDGSTLQRGQSRKISDSTFDFGDPLATAFIGWNSGNWHWKLTGLINIPIGSYDKANITNMGFNHWAEDLTGGMTWLDPKSGMEVSLAPGFTFNSENSATKYRSGTEFHLEGAVMKHLSKDFAFGVAGYYYDQITGDSGSGAVLGPFEGQVSAIGPNITYNFMAGQVPVLTSVRWEHEFDAKNRLAGDAGFLTVLIPLGGSATAH